MHRLPMASQIYSVFIVLPIQSGLSTNHR